MQEITRGIHIGNETDCRQQQGRMKIIHVCKTPCHQNIVGYRGSLSPTHNEYLVAKRPDNLYLNMVDMNTPQRPKFMDPMLREVFAFTQENQGQNILIHCNQGHSRAPAIGLLYLAKIVHTIPNTNYDEARHAFVKQFRFYAPNKGIMHYMHKHWKNIDQLIPQTRESSP